MFKPSKQAPIWLITYRFPQDTTLSPSLMPEILAIREAELELVLFPYEVDGPFQQELPTSVRCDLVLNHHPESSLPFRALKGLISSWTWKELLTEDWAKALRTPHHLLNRSSRVFHYAPILKSRVGNYFSKTGRLPIIYTDRFDALTYTACSLKQDFPQLKVVTRAIGYDIYRERYTNDYPPLRLQFANMPDMICPVSEIGSKYLINEYGINPKRVKTYYRGVTPAKTCSAPGAEGTLELLSCSYCTPIKRLDLLIRNIAVYCSTRPNLNVHWIHIGDGECYASLIALAHVQLDALPNLRWEMPGRMTQAEIKQYYSTHPVDAHILISALEGLPKTIIEAQAFGVPSIATEVGGIPEVLDSRTGITLPRDFTQQDFTLALDNIVMFRAPESRKQIQHLCNKRFNGELNTRKLVDEVFIPLSYST